MKGLCVALVVLFCLFNYCLTYIITVEAFSEECFYEEVKNDTEIVSGQGGSHKMSLTFEVIEGGFLDIDVKVTAPTGAELITRERESNGKITFSAEKPGKYKYCFSNAMSTLTSKQVMFSMDVVKPYQNLNLVKENRNDMLDLGRELTWGLVGVKQDTEYMQVRDKIHHQINESTNHRVVIWTFFQAFMCLAVTFCQVFFLKRFFEVRRMV